MKNSVPPSKGGRWLRPCWVATNYFVAECRGPKFRLSLCRSGQPRNRTRSPWRLHLPSPDYCESMRNDPFDRNCHRFGDHFRPQNCRQALTEHLGEPTRYPGDRETHPIERAAADLLYSIENPRLWGGCTEWAGGLGGGWGLTELSNQRGRIFRVERPRPSSCGAAANHCTCI